VPLKIKLLLSLFLLISTVANAQLIGFPSGARSGGLGNASVTIGDSYSIFNNVGGLAEAQGINIVFANENRTRMEGLGTVGAAITAPIAFGVGGISVSRFGDDLYNQQVIGAGFSNKIGIVSLGGKINYLQYNLEGFGRRAVMALEFGGVAKLSPQLIFGAHVFNLNQAKVSRFEKEYLPTLLKAGLAYRPTKELSINIESEKDVDQKANFKAGLEYEIVKTVFVRTGLNSYPFSSHYGIGLNPGRFVLDYALTSNIFFGMAHQFSLQFQFHKK
jgi:hypothetical protein